MLHSVYPQRIDWSVKMFDELLVKNPHVKRMCEHYQVDIDGCHCALIKDMIRGKRKEPSDDSSDEEAGEKSKRKQSSNEKAFLLEVRIIIISINVCIRVHIDAFRANMNSYAHFGTPTCRQATIQMY